MGLVEETYWHSQAARGGDVQKAWQGLDWTVTGFAAASVFLTEGLKLLFERLSQNQPTELDLYGARGAGFERS